MKKKDKWQQYNDLYVLLLLAELNFLDGKKAAYL